MKQWFAIETTDGDSMVIRTDAVQAVRYHNPQDGMTIFLKKQSPVRTRTYDIIGFCTDVIEDGDVIGDLDKSND